MFLNFPFFLAPSSIVYFRFLALFVIGISACLFTFRMRGFKSGGFVPTTHYKLIESQVRERRVSCS